VSNPLIIAAGAVPPDIRRPPRGLEDVISDMVDAGMSDEEIRGAIGKRPAAKPAYSPTQYGAPENKAGPYTPERQAADTRDRAEANALLLGSADERDLVDGGTSDQIAYMRQHPGHKAAADAEGAAKGFSQFAVGQALGPLVTGGLMKLGVSPGVANIGGGAMTGAVPSAMAGNSGGEIVKDAAFGAAIPALGAGLTGLGRGILASKGGQARQLIEARGGNVGIGDSGSGLPEFEGRGKITDADISESARTAGQKLLAANDARFDAEGRRPYRAAKAEIDRGQGRNLVDVIPLRRELLSVANDPSTLPGTRSALLGQVKEMDAQFPLDNGRQYAPESWVNGKTSMLMDMANVGKARFGDMTPRDAKVASVASVGQKMREAGPYADANRRYAAAKTESGDFREALGLNRSPAANEAVDERKAANMLSRRGDSTRTAGIQRKEAQRLEEMLASDPALARIADSPELLRAKADLQFHVGTPAHGGLLDRVGVPAGAVIGDLLGAAAGGGHGGLKGAAMGIASALAAQNAAPIAGRLLYNPARAAVPVGQELTNFSAKWNPVIQAYFQAAQRDEELNRSRAAALNAQ